jgi:NAD(P)-dependent dehydrogenase (short-subunit alcohol dehydrogenase family)
MRGAVGAGKFGSPKAYDEDSQRAKVKGEAMLNDKVVLITGGSRGLGRVLAKVFAAEGAKVVIAARRADALESTRREIEAAGGVVLALAADMTQPQDIGRVVTAAIDRFGRIDVLINNAGTLGPTPRPALIDTDPDALLETFRVNTVGPLRVTQAVLPRMIERGGGLIVNVTSDAARGAYLEWGAYGASKAALELIGLTWAAELQGTGVRVVNVDPGDLQTEMQQAASPGEDISDRALPESAAPAFVWLASQAGSVVTGERIQAQEFKRETPGFAV